MNKYLDRGAHLQLEINPPIRTDDKLSQNNNNLLNSFNIEMYLSQVD